MLEDAEVDLRGGGVAFWGILTASRLDSMGCPAPQTPPGPQHVVQEGLKPASHHLGVLKRQGWGWGLHQTGPLTQFTQG